jgi:hypothetical protein
MVFRWCVAAVDTAGRREEGFAFHRAKNNSSSNNARPTASPPSSAGGKPTITRTVPRTQRAKKRTTCQRHANHGYTSTSWFKRRGDVSTTLLPSTTIDSSAGNAVNPF